MECFVQVCVVYCFKSIEIVEQDLDYVQLLHGQYDEFECRSLLEWCFAVFYPTKRCIFQSFSHD